MLKKLLLATAIVGATISTASADNVSGTMNLKVTLPEILVLYHWQEAGIQFEPNKYDMPTGKGAGTYDFAGNIQVADNDGNADGAGVSDTPMNLNDITGRTNATTIPVVLKNSWAVRTLTENGKAKLAIANTKAEHKKGDDSVVLTKEAKVSQGNKSGTEIELDSKWAPTTGDITFDLDLTGATKAGLHQADDATFTLKLTGK
ncbi:Uncharacterised protein [Moraxella caprae]|uniref:MatB fimbrillin n=1 Tax=Moraxella caprae TaxID=90240 RepID=A0A378QYD7_9GAMM|nr:hypothetical protein [Moraxella caprae]STZ07974.1 Uncharacterised protein [Moraxella caprae]